MKKNKKIKHKVNLDDSGVIPPPIEDDTPEVTPVMTPDEAWFNEQIAKRKQPELPSPMETVWGYVSPLPEIHEPQLVAEEKVECNVCGGSGCVRRKQIGQTYGAERWVLRACPCLRSRAYSYLNRKLELRDRGIRFDSLAPSDASDMCKEDQAFNIELIKSYPDKSFFICGPPGWSKSTLSLALYDRAIQNQIELCLARSQQYLLDAVRLEFPVWRIYANTLVKEAKDKEYFEGADPTVSEKKIKAALRAGWVPRLFVEEIEKIGNVTTDRLKQLWEIIKLVYDNHGQVVVTSNLAPRDFEREFGTDLFRRIIDHKEGDVINLFETARPAQPTTDKPVTETPEESEN